MVLLSVCCLTGRPRAPLVSICSRCSNRANKASGGSSLMRAAASSIAKGSPSRHTQISAAGHQDLQSRASAEEFHQRWGCRYDLLEVVEQQQYLLLTQIGVQTL